MNAYNQEIQTAKEDKYLKVSLVSPPANPSGLLQKRLSELSRGEWPDKMEALEDTGAPPTPARAHPE